MDTPVTRAGYELSPRDRTLLDDEIDALEPGEAAFLSDGKVHARLGGILESLSSGPAPPGSPLGPAVTYQRGTGNRGHSARSDLYRVWGRDLVVGVAVVVVVTIALRGCHGGAAVPVGPALAPAARAAEAWNAGVGRLERRDATDRNWRQCLRAVAVEKSGAEQMAGGAALSPDQYEGFERRVVACYRAAHAGRVP